MLHEHHDYTNAAAEGGYALIKGFSPEQSPVRRRSCRADVVPQLQGTGAAGRDQEQQPTSKRLPRAAGREQEQQGRTRRSSRGAGSSPNRSRARSRAAVSIIGVKISIRACRLQ